jgi:hypothetical protein
MVRRFKKFLKKKGYQGAHNKSGKSYSNNPFAKKKCFECGEMGHISTNCKNKDEESSIKSKKFEGKKKLFKKYNKKKMTWLAMLNEIRMLVRILILILTMMMMNPPRRVLPKLSLRRLSSLFDTPYCLTAKGEPKVCDDDAFLYDDLVERISNPDDVLRNIIRKYKDLKKKHASLQDFY